MKKKGNVVLKCEKKIVGFKGFTTKFQQKVILAGRSKETFKNYIRAIAQTALFYNKLPLELTDDQINHYLLLHKTGELSRITPSESCFKHTVFGFRYMYKTFGIENRSIAMPIMKRKKHLPDIINRVELIELLHAPKIMKHRIMFALAYGSGLRIGELCNVKLADIDIVTKTIHVRNTKTGYDRIVPICADFIRGLQSYLHQNQIEVYLFPGQHKDKPISISAVQHALCSARRKAGIRKKISMHNLRHSYATHFIEDTGDLLRLKKYLGHRDIKNTMRYLKTAQEIPQGKPYSPLSRVFDMARESINQ